MSDDDSDLDLMGVLVRVTPRGPGREDDSALVSTGVVQSVDVDKRAVTVRVRGGVVTLPAIAARYQVGGLVRVLLDATAGRPIHVLGAVDVSPPVMLATVTEWPTGKLITVTIDGRVWKLPVMPGAYTVGDSAWLHLDDWGVPVLALGPSSLPPQSTGGGDSGGGQAPTLVTATATFGPQSSGTFRQNFGRWDTWGGDTGWGLSDLYQGDGYGSGPLTGLACYGDQVVNLGAVEIQKITLTAQRNSSGRGGYLRVQGAPHGARPAGAPAPSGVSVTAGLVGNLETTYVDLPPELCEAFRTGAVKGLCTVGDGYAGFGGTATPGSFTISITYTRKA